MDGLVVLLFGPSGVGKSTTAAAVASELGWRHVEEDTYWVRRGWGGLRTNAREAQVQADVVRDILATIDSGQNVVLDFILYKPAPNPLTVYLTAFRQAEVASLAIGLRSSVETVTNRMKGRGRPRDLMLLAERRSDVSSQLDVLASIDDTVCHVIDSTELTLPAVTERCLTLVDAASDQE